MKQEKDQAVFRGSAGREVRIAVDRGAVRTPRLLPPCPYEFPDPGTAGRNETVVARGGVFYPGTGMAAYRRGLFAWPHEDEEYLWFSPEPRATLPVDGVRISRRLGRTIRNGRFTATVDRAFEDVMTLCAVRPGEGTWITPALIEGYVALHEAGHAHSVEVWDGYGSLAGGLYGVAAGAMFGAESMFYRVRDASKVALVALAEVALEIGIELIDVQVVTEHTQRMGVVEIPRRDYLSRLKVALQREVSWG